MNKLFFAATAALLLAGCGEDAKQQSTIAASDTLVSGINTEYMDTSVKPGDDFFMFVNGKWIESAEIPADKSSFGGFIILRDEAEERVKVIIEDASTGDFVKGSDEQKIGDFYKAYMDLEARNALGAKPLQPEFERINAIASKGDLAVYMASANRRGFPMPFLLIEIPDMKNPDFYAMNLYQGGLGLPDREYYFNDDAKSVEIRNKYRQHIQNMFTLAGLANAEKAATTVLDIETRIAEHQLKKEDTRNWAANYNKVQRAELVDVMPNFNWDGYLGEAGLAEIDSLVVFMTDYLGKLDGIIQDTSLDTWKIYLHWTALRTMGNALSEDFEKESFDFYSRTLSGTEEQRPLWRRGVTTVNGNLGELVGKAYVDRHFPPEAKERMEALVGNLIKAYEKSISELDWMSEDTKKEALKKLHKFTPKIGYPEKWRDYSTLEIDGKDLVGNLERVQAHEYQRQLDRIGGPVDRTEWGMTPQTVNAYYSPVANEIVFPAAILQPPFFNFEAEDAVNYGAIGAVIGHEIGHGFDDKGSTFDGDGALRNWWKDEDRAEFEARTSKLVAQYDAFAPFEDLNVNGTFTLGENIGDLGGISIGLLAYKMSLEGKEPPVIDGFTGVQRVFLGYGQIWRIKYREEALRHLIKTNPHAPSVYRANGAVRNVPEFYEAFDVKEGDALYLPPEERVKIW